MCNGKKKNMIILKNEACLRGKGCIATPKTFHTGRLPKQQRNPPKIQKDL